MPRRIEKLSVKSLRSIGDERVTTRFPESGALVLLGENNAGKSNVTRALDMLFGGLLAGDAPAGGPRVPRARKRRHRG